ncbi:MAG: Eco57I restriction-modification methylase domain-containing protein [Candidatus Sericytochromatia bacterium]|nr:Eco57I restriction-modification methylase domain-containing protein [Candidatus Sericytochromatia bacterium]
MSKHNSDWFLPPLLWRQLQARSAATPDWRANCLQTLVHLVWPAHLPENTPPSDLTLTDDPLLLALAEWVAGVTDIWARLQRLALLSELLASQPQRKQTGLYYTPPRLARYLAETSLRPLWQGPHKVLHCLDPACGSGMFLWALFQTVWDWGLGAISNLKQREKLSFEWISALRGCDLDPQALEVARIGFVCFWQHCFPGRPMPQPRLHCGDALAASESGQLQLADWLADQPPLDLLLSNPPYLGEKNHRAVFEPLRQGPWAADYRGRGDLYYYFFYLALKLGQPQTLAGLLTPSYFLSASGAAHLRQRLLHDSSLLQLIDFQSLRLFPGAQGQHNAFTLLRCAPPDPAHQVALRRALHPRARSRQLQASDLDALDQQAPDYRPQHALFQGRTALMLSQASEAVAAQLQQLEQQAEPLGTYFSVSQGIVSGADRLSAQQQKAHGIVCAPGSGIFVINPDESTRLEGALRQAGLDPADWLRPWFKNSDIQPFAVNTCPRYQLLYLHRGVQTLPAVLEAHLQPFYPVLARRREVMQGRLPWWQLQWPRQPGRFTGPKLVLPQRAESVRAAYTALPWYASADVYFIQPRSAAASSGWQLELLELWLNSPLVSQWFYHRGKRKGALLELYQQPLSQVPLPRIAPAQQRRLQQWLRGGLPERSQRGEAAYQAQLTQMLKQYLMLE